MYCFQQACAADAKNHKEVIGSQQRQCYKDCGVRFLSVSALTGEQESLKLSRVNSSKQGSVPTELRAPGGPE